MSPPEHDAIDSGLPPRVKKAVQRARAASEWVTDQIEHRSGLWDQLAASGALDRPANGAYFAELGDEIRVQASDRDDLMRRLREARSREALRIAIRDLGGLADLGETLAELTDLADALIDAALAWLDEELQGRFGTPRSEDGEPLRLVVMGMGKLGGGELNFSSDVDLLFAYRQAGRTDGAKALEAEEYFQRLARALAQVLSDMTADGYVYRVDLRLRPHGEAGRLALSFAAMEDYYQREGRNWERYAWVKARPVAGDREAGEALVRMLRPFIYRRYLDFPALEALRELKRQVAAEVKRRNLADDIKLGSGGIREIEFVAQVFQLIRGGRDPALRDRRLWTTIERLAERRLLTVTAAEELMSAYEFLRRLENRLQMYRDEQTHRLPEDRQTRERIAGAMGFDDWSGLARALDDHRERVARHFDAVFQPDEEPEDESDAEALLDLWQDPQATEDSLARLSALGFSDPASVIEHLDRFRQSTRVRAMGSRGRERLERFMPRLLTMLGHSGEPDRALPRLLQVLESIARRSVYLTLLLENTPVVERLCRLCGTSAWVAEQLARAPILLDELIDPRLAEIETDLAAVQAELGRALAAVPGGDLEQEMEALAQFKRARTLLIALAELSGELRAPEAGTQLSHLATALVSRALALARRDLVAAHGAPPGEDREAGGFAIIAYGRLGSEELSYDSDLDLVFLFDGEAGGTDGERPLDGARFHMRLAQRVIHILTSPGPFGRLYEVDTRLRPNGRAGLLVSPLAAYRTYQLDEAWTWEQQALVRARAITGGGPLVQGFDEVRRKVLGRRRDERELARSVTSMRKRMETERGTGGNELKHGRGGLVDLEFLVQYAVLRHGHEAPALLERANTRELLECLARQDFMPDREARDLVLAHETLTAGQHLRVLGAEGEGLDTGAARDRVAEAWRRRFGQGSSSAGSTSG